MSSSHSHGEAGHEHGSVGHIVPLRILFGTWAALIVLTVVTVGSTYIDLGDLNIVIALLIAVVKSAFVVLFFMHLKYDKPFHAIVFVSATLFVMLFISLALMDSKEYLPSKIPGYASELAPIGEPAAAETAPAATEGAAPADGAAHPAEGEAPAAGTEAPAGH
ncbi:MAG: cytochrome C oxidase subunit IV family protein [Candidatus Eiseniibacteriota bacterium]